MSYNEFIEGLRDKFAGDALTGILASSDNGESEPTVSYVSNGMFTGDQSASDWVAKLSYHIADAMIRARNSK